MATHSSVLAWDSPGKNTGEGNGNPLQCSCLENPRDGGAWWAAVSGPNLTLVLCFKPFPGKWGQQTIRLGGLAPSLPWQRCTGIRAPSSLLLVAPCFLVLKTSCPFTSTEMHFLHVLDCVELLEWGDFQSISLILA